MGVVDSSSSPIEMPRRCVWGQRGLSTMRLQPTIALTAMLCLALGASALADRLAEKKESATHVVIGKVQAVYTRESRDYRYYIAEVRISEVIKGHGLAPGNFFYASSYQRKPGAVGWDGAGHLSVPTAGQHVKVYLRYDRGLFSGVYPDWCETMPTPQRNRP
jgi:hypothetical protein